MRKNCQQKITMTLIQTMHPIYFAFHVGKQGVRSSEIGALAPVFEKSDTVPQPKPNLLRGKNIINIVTFNIRTLNTKI